MHENPAYLAEAVRAGAAGYLLKDVSREELVDAIRQVATGGAFIESQMLKGMLSEMKPTGPVPAAARNLTKREGRSSRSSGGHEQPGDRGAARPLAGDGEEPRRRDPSRSSVGVGPDEAAIYAVGTASSRG